MSRYFRVPHFVPAMCRSRAAHSISAGRLEYETITREAGGTTNLTRTQYAYSFATYHRQVVRTEQEYQVAAWVNADKVTYKYDGMERLDYEERHDWDDVGSTWVTRYDTTQEYDKNGNRTRLHKNVAAGYTASYGEEMDLSYTFSNVNALTAIADDDDALYSCAVTSDANNNITAVQETATVGAYTADLYTYFSYDWANRLGNWWVRAYDSGQKDWQLTKREHGYDAAGRLINSTYKQWWEEDEEPEGDYLEHTYAGSRHIQNYDGSSTYGEVWHWAGAQNAHAAPVKSPNPDTASQAAFNIANDKTPQRTTWQTPTTAGDARNLYGQGKPMPKDSSGDGADWGTGIESYTTAATVLQIESRLDFDGTVAPTDLDRATDAREKSRIGIFGSSLAYTGSSGRVTSEPLGRDLNPLGRGSGMALVGGDVNLGRISPALPLCSAGKGSGSSINNLTMGFTPYSIDNECVVPETPILPNYKLAEGASEECRACRKKLKDSIDDCYDRVHDECQAVMDKVCAAWKALYPKVESLRQQLDELEKQKMIAEEQLKKFRRDRPELEKLCHKIYAARVAICVGLIKDPVSYSRCMRDASKQYILCMKIIDDTEARLVKKVNDLKSQVSDMTFKLWNIESDLTGIEGDIILLPLHTKNGYAECFRIADEMKDKINRELQCGMVYGAVISKEVSLIDEDKTGSTVITADCSLSDDIDSAFEYGFYNPCSSVGAFY